MPLTRLMIQQFRNIESCDLQLSPSFNFIIGRNGSGKTSFLEAIYLLGHGRSFKSNLLNRVIQYDSAELFVHARVAQQADMTLPLGICRRRDGSAEIKIGQKSGGKLAELAQILPLQLIHPEGFELLTDGPKQRRAFLDWGVFHCEPLFHATWARFRRLNKQRHALLKTASTYQELAIWDQTLATLAEQIDVWRNNYVQQLQPIANEILQTFLPEHRISLAYYRGWEKHTPYQQILTANFARDQQLGYTVSGPNKADIRLKVGTHPVEDVLSRGQLKLMLCGLRLAQGQHLLQVTGKQCIYLMDDFASELDEAHQGRLAAGLRATEAQVFVSSITEQQISAMRDEKSKMFIADCGKIEPQ